METVDLYSMQPNWLQRLRHEVPLVVCVFNDSGYELLRWLQDNRFGRINETDLGKIAFAKMARSMGVPARRLHL